MESRGIKDKIRVVLVDDHPLVLQGLTAIIEQEEDIFVCGVASEGDSAVGLIQELKPDIVLVDIVLKGRLNGIEFIRLLRRLHPEMRLLVLSMHEEAVYVDHALRAGAQGYVTKRDSPENLLEAIRKTHSGQKFLSNCITEISSVEPPPSRRGGTVPFVELLSCREMEVFQLFGQGFSSKEIAERLSICVSTVETYRARIKKRLKLKSSTELLKNALAWREFAQEMSGGVYN